MQIKGIFSSALWRDPLKSNLRANFEAFKYENDNRVGAPDCGAEVWDLSRPPIEWKEIKIGLGLNCFIQLADFQAARVHLSGLNESVLRTLSLE